MTIRWAFERQSGSKKDLSNLRIGMRKRWLPIAVALAFVPGFVSGQIPPGSMRNTGTRSCDYISGFEAGLSTRRRS